MRLIIAVQGGAMPFTFDAEQITTLFIGRFNAETGYSPDIDLQEYGGQEKGVSRRHAAIMSRDDSLYLADSGSPNGTYLNEVRLFPKQPRVLREGDTIRVGRLTLHITLAKE